MSTTISGLLGEIQGLEFNPAGIQRVILKHLTDITDGKIEVVDPTNPVVFTLESAAVLVAAAMMKDETNTRRQYPIAAQLMSDLYLHMSDKDFVDLFASPSKSTWSLMLGKEECINRMVLDPETGIRKMVIPRNSVFTVANTSFTLQYPIEIRQLQHGGLQVVYDTDILSPLQELTTNVLPWEIRRGNDLDWIWFEFDLYQFSIVTGQESISPSVELSIQIGITDQYQYARAYVENDDLTWTEIRTTYTDQLYDITVPTVTLKVIGQTVYAAVPQIYTASGTLKNKVRVDVYQTKGELNMVLGSYGMDEFGAAFIPIDDNDATVFVAPLSLMQTVLPYSQSILSGGGDALDFETVRTRVIKNATGSVELPITNVRIEADLNNMGYEVVKNIDNITNRVFLATRNMPTPANEKLLTAAAASIETLTLSILDAIAVNTVIDNGSSVTITPKTIYKSVNGVVQMVQDAELASLLALPADKRALAVTNGNYLYTPFHYVLDTTGVEFESRPYYLDEPVIDTRLFVSENDTTMIQVTTDTYGVFKTDTGYLVRIATTSGDAYKTLADDKVYCQLAYTPAGEKDRAYVMGTLVGKDANMERIYEFDLSSNMNVNAGDNLELTKFLMYTTEPRITGAPLLTDFDVIYSTTAPMSNLWKTAEVDTVLGRFLLPDDVVGITHEKLRLRFGRTLDTLWAQSRSVIDSLGYQTYPADVPYYYTENIYVTDPVTNSIFHMVDGALVYNDLLHAQGDPVLDPETGQQTYQHRAGDPILDADLQPIPLSGRGMLRQIDIMLIEGAYWFATDATAITYKSDMTDTLVSWLIGDLTAINSQLLEQTRIYYYPKTTLGVVDVMIKDGLKTSINAGQAFKVSLYVHSAVYDNSDLRQQLTKKTITTIAAGLTDVNVSMSAITSNLRTQYATDVIDVEVTGLGGDANLATLTMIDSSDRCSIRKRLVAQSDESLICEEDITVDFVRHEIVN